MLHVQKLDLTDKKYVDKHFGKLLLDSYNYDCKQNDLTNASSIEKIRAKLQTDHVYVVFRLSKFVGFFVNPTNLTVKEVSFKLFRYPQACPMSARSLVKAAFIRALLIGVLDRENFDRIEFVLWHLGFTHVVRSIIPLVEIHNITVDHIIGFYKLEKSTEEYLKILYKYLGVHGKEQINTEDFKVVL